VTLVADLRERVLVDLARAEHERQAIVAHLAELVGGVALVFTPRRYRPAAVDTAPQRERLGLLIDLARAAVREIAEVVRAR
jgi:hypothetical protein